MGVCIFVDTKLYIIYVNKVEYDKSQVSFLIIPASRHKGERVAGGMTNKLATLKNKSHTGQREGPRWKTLVFVCVVSLVLWYVPSSTIFLCKSGSQVSEFGVGWVPVINYHAEL